RATRPHAPRMSADLRGALGIGPCRACLYIEGMTPSATGTLAATPLAHALVYSRNRRLTGRLELVTTDERQATISLWRGSITAVETVPVGLCPGGFFGAIAYELGFIDSDVLDATLLEIAKSKRLHGEVLIERKAMTPAQRDE